MPLLLQVPGEAARPLGPGAEPSGDGPAWWIEARAAVGVPKAEQLAGAFAARPTMLLGSRVWPPDALGTVGAACPVDVSGVTAVPAPAAAQQAVDMLTDEAAIVLHNRPVVPMTSWLSEVLRATVESERSLQIVTPPPLPPLPARMLLQSTPSRWVVQDERCGYYDGLNGAVLRWQYGAFSLALDENGETPVADAFTEVRRTGERQLIVSFCTLRRPEAVVLGGALEAAWQGHCRSRPVNW
ncbi:DUF6177 family protein [Streptomyces lavendulae]|uniref:DUF6177 family protein n=1 Tax=Streptomyces lavendulae TaxID=1914 RepID=UPI003713369C